jgi:hypothetical protein
MKRLIPLIFTASLKLLFETFHDGNDKTWAPTRPCHAEFTDFRITKPEGKYALKDQRESAIEVCKNKSEPFLGK